FFSSSAPLTLFSTLSLHDALPIFLYTIAKYPNICNNIHLPIQSGSSRVLDLMNRTYTREWYIDRINAIRRIVPNCGISTDIISGFCTETEQDHEDTLSIIDRKSTRLNSSHVKISYAVFCLKKQT